MTEKNPEKETDSGAALTAAPSPLSDAVENHAETASDNTKEIAGPECSGAPEKSKSTDNSKVSRFSPDYLANRSIHKLFWGYLVGGSIFWLVVFYGTGTLLALSDKTKADTAGLLLLIVAVVTYLWGFVFSVITGMGIWRLKGRPWLKYGYSAGLLLYIIVLFSGLLVFIHVSMML